MRIPPHPLFLAGLMLLVIPACGSGSRTSSVPTLDAPQAMVLGVVVSRDGSSAELDGIEIETEDGKRIATTDMDGRFEAPVRAGRRFRLRFHDPRAQGSILDEDLEEGDDDTPDDTDIDGDELEIEELDEDEVCEVEVELDGGEVVGSWVERDREQKDGDGDPRREYDGETPLCPPEGKVEDGPRGEIEFSGDEDCIRVELEAEGLDDYDMLEVVLELPDATQSSLGYLDIDDEGEAHFVLEACVAEEIPFGVETLTDLTGAKLLILNDLEEIILMGKLPMRRGIFDEEHEREGGEHGRDDNEDKDEDGKEGGDSRPRVEDFKLEAATEDSDAQGGGVVKCFPDCCVLVIEVGGLTAEAEYGIVLLDAEENEADLGDIEVGEEGAGRFAEEFCEDLPFEAATLEDLAGYTLSIVDADGATVLQGQLPAFPAEEETAAAE